MSYPPVEKATRGDAITYAHPYILHLMNGIGLNPSDCTKSMRMVKRRACVHVYIDISCCEVVTS